jgi:hypothetical protein
VDLFAYASSPEVGEAASRMSRRLLADGSASLLKSSLFGVGVGSPEGSKEYLLFLADENVIGQGFTYDTDMVAKVLEEVGVSWDEKDEEVPPLMLGVPVPSPQAAQFTCNQTQATIGASVRSSEDKLGAITAGHAARPVGAIVQDEDGTHIGRVVFTEQPGDVDTAVSADVAVIELAGVGTPGRFFKGGAPVFPGSEITIETAHGSISETILGFMDYMSMPSMGGLLGSTYLTYRGVTHAGDSGSLVVMEDLIVGHVIGASGAATTYIQDIEFQLHRSRARLA